MKRFGIRLFTPLPVKGIPESQEKADPLKGGGTGILTVDNFSAKIQGSRKWRGFGKKLIETFPYYVETLLKKYRHRDDQPVICV